MDLDAYRTEAEAFVSALDREYYLHFSGRREEYDIEPIYERHAGLFSREAVDALRSSGNADLLEFAVHGLIGRATKAEQAELARIEAGLEVELEGERLPYREAAVAQANEPDPRRRAALEAARHGALDEALNPLLGELLERSHALARELGWRDTTEMCEELSGIDLGELGDRTDDVLAATEDLYAPMVAPHLERQLGIGLEGLRRADLPAFFRAPALDRHFPAEGLVPSLEETLAGLGIRLSDQPGVLLDTEHRPKKSPRAFCAAVRVPDEVHLVIARIGGREDYAALFHEAGHTEHYAHVDPGMAMEHRYLGDNSVTECFAFLFEHLVADPLWLRQRLGVDGAEAEEVVGYSRAVTLVFLRRYCAKLSYELALHGSKAVREELPGLYARGLSEAVRVEWPEVTWLSDVDPFFYAARYLRAWALEAHVRRELMRRFGPAWFEEADAGELLRGLWAEGQRGGAEGLIERLGAGALDFSALLDELGVAAAA